jgi:putative Holliday junction resolvase
VLEEIAGFAVREEVTLAVFGIPRSPEGAESALAGRIRAFAAKFERKTGLPVRFHEETLTSNEAARRLSRRASKEDLDRAAAAVLLEDYLASGGRGAR